MTSRVSSAPELADARRAAAALADAGVARVVLFGSVARGDATAHSDIDLMAIYDDLDYAVRWETRCALKPLAESAAGYPVDVVVTDRPEWKVRTTHVSTSFQEPRRPPRCGFGRPAAHESDRLGQADGDAAQRPR